MNDFASPGISDASDRIQVETWPRRVGLLVLIASLLVILSTGCSDGQLPTDDPTPYATRPAHDD